MNEVISRVYRDYLNHALIEPQLSEEEIREAKCGESYHVMIRELGSPYPKCKYCGVLLSLVPMQYRKRVRYE